MPSSPVKQVDVAVIGAGIAGLWTARLLSASGLSIAIIQSDAIGAGQTIAAQGIIHSGTKYTLTRRLTGASEAISQMPAQWVEALNGRHTVSLSATAQRATSCILWSASPISARLTTFLAARVMKARVALIKPHEQPRIIQRPPAGTTCYRLAERVLDLPSLIDDLARPIKDRILHAHAEIAGQTPDQARFAEHYTLALRSADSTAPHAMTLHARSIIATAGTGNETLLRSLGFPADCQAQRRPLHMVCIRGPLPEAVFGHCIGARSRPRLTVTSHEWDGDRHERIWYLGGELAESGVQRARDEQIAAASRELAQIFPTLDQATLHGDTFRIDRAEPRQPDGARPDEPVIMKRGRAFLAWPTKLAFAPLLAQRLLEAINEAQIKPGADRPEPLEFPTTLCLAEPPWKVNRQWSPLDPSAKPA